MHNDDDKPKRNTKKKKNSRENRKKNVQFWTFLLVFGCKSYRQFEFLA